MKVLKDAVIQWIFHDNYTPLMKASRVIDLEFADKLRKLHDDFNRNPTDVTESKFHLELNNLVKMIYDKHPKTFSSDDKSVSMVAGKRR